VGVEGNRSGGIPMARNTMGARPFPTVRHRDGRAWSVQWRSKSSRRLAMQPGAERPAVGARSFTAVRHGWEPITRDGSWCPPGAAPWRWGLHREVEVGVLPVDGESKVGEIGRFLPPPTAMTVSLHLGKIPPPQPPCPSPFTSGARAPANQHHHHFRFLF
jgi:hypothetical protein